MYFIKTGILQVVSPDGTKVFAQLKAGAAFGEIRFDLNLIQNYIYPINQWQKYYRLIWGR